MVDTYKLRDLENLIEPLEEYTEDQIDGLREDLGRSAIDGADSLREVLTRLLEYRKEYDF